MRAYFALLICLLPLISPAQEKQFHETLFEKYDLVKEKSLTQRRTKHAQIQPLIEKLSSNKAFEVRSLSESIEGRKISMISIGSGETDVLLWSQMHGNEPTATLAIFDILNLLANDNLLSNEKEQILKNTRLHFIPMLNPDGAEVFKRRNALDIDLNRDALRLQTPEGKILKAVRDSLDADFGFNLHDQSKYYNAERTEKPATISYLAPAYNYSKSINNVRSNAMKVIVFMNDIIQKYAPGQVGRYSDAFEPRAFGDNIMKWGTSAILIESGGYAGDPEKQFIRKLNFISIFSAIYAIANGEYNDISISRYEKIPNNNRKLFDVKIEGLTYNLNDKDYILDVGIMHFETDNEAHDDFHYVGRIVEVGDLSTYYGYQHLKADGLRYEVGRLYTEKTFVFEDLKNLDFKKYLEQGYTDLLIDKLPEGVNSSEYPINLTKSNSVKNDEIKLGRNATFLLKDEGKIKYVIVNGFVFDINGKSSSIVNGVIR